jgi:hypothetical protein
MKAEKFPEVSIFWNGRGRLSENLLNDYYATDITSYSSFSVKLILHEIVRDSKVFKYNIFK